MILNSIRLALGAVAVGAVALGAGIATTPADASTNQSAGGCASAWRAPHGAVANDCRTDGWHVDSRLVLNPRAIIRYVNLPLCREEDGSAQRMRCVWLGNGPSGNGHGLSYTEHAGRFLPFWQPSPVTSGRWHWVNQSLADALAEGSAPDATTRDWEQCATRTVPGGRVVKCADGYRESTASAKPRCPVRVPPASDRRRS